MKFFTVLFLSLSTIAISQEGLCDSIYITNKTTSGFHMQAAFNYDTIFSYCGFALYNQSGEAVATQKGGNFYGIINNYETQYYLASSIENHDYFEGTLILIDRYHVGGTDTICIFPYTLNEVTTSLNSSTQKTNHLVRVTDLSGNPTSPEPNKILFYHYSDGSIEKQLLLK